MDYTRINEDFLDDSDIKLDDVSVIDDIREELQNWVNNDEDDNELSFDPQRLPDAFFRVTFQQLKTAVIKMIRQFGPECSLNWLDVSQIEEMPALFYKSPFNGDISRWDVSNVRVMSDMFNGSKFNGNISGWNTRNVMFVYNMFSESDFNQDISSWNMSSLVDGFQEQSMFMRSKVKDAYKPKFD